MNDKFLNDSVASMQVIGGLLRDPSILDKTNDYTISIDDFSVRLHRIIFSSINNLYVKGLIKIEPIDIYNYLDTVQNKNQKLEFDKENGLDFIQSCLDISGEGKFDYYYQKIKKLRVLKELNAIGLDTTKFYDPNGTDFDLKERQRLWLDSISIQELVDVVSNELDDVLSKFQVAGTDTAIDGGEGIMELLEELEETPAIGYQTYDPVLTRIMMGMRAGKYSIISASSGVGKTRQMAAMCAEMSASHKYDIMKQEWVALPTRVPSLFIATEQDLSEIQTLWLSYISKVDEEHILNQKLLLPTEKERVIRAAQIIKDSPFHLVEMPDFGIKDIEDAIRTNIEKYNIEVCFFDYINTSIKILSEIAGSARINMREDQILYLLSTRLKELAVSYGISMMSATQTNRSSGDSSEASSSMLKGASAIVEKADFGAIMMRPTQEDKEMRRQLMQKANTSIEPNMIMSIYKNRRGKYSVGKIWMRADLGTCTFQTVFYTDHDYNLEQIEGYEITYN